MKKKLKFICCKCQAQVTIPITVTGNPMILNKDIKKATKESGWQIGRYNFCPTCAATLTAHCKTCQHFDDTSSSEIICKLDKQPTLPYDFCPLHKPREEDPNPAPALNFDNIPKGLPLPPFYKK